MASYRESSELEYGADDAFLLAPDSKSTERVTLRHLKSRYGECRDIALRFDGAIQRFAAVGDAPPEWDPNGGPGRLHSDLTDLWNQTPPAGGDSGRDF